MGVPVGHPFFGNQYTDGGYIAGTFKYVPEIAEKVVDYSSTLISENTDKATTKVITRQNPKNLILKALNTKGNNKNALIAVIIGLATLGGYCAYKPPFRRYAGGTNSNEKWCASFTTGL